MEITPRQFNNVGYIVADVPMDLMDKLREKIYQIQNNPELAVPGNKGLIGHIIKEYELTNSEKLLEPYILELVEKYDSSFDFGKQIKSYTDGVPLTLGTPWVNFQKKYEFNPVHNHSGILSYVIYVKIPYDLEQEFAEGPGKLSNQPMNGCFQFLFTNSLGHVAVHTMNIDKTFENKILLFPAMMNHCVYPFYTSDEYRISIAGNVFLDTSKYRE
jgi:hypothetical protein